MEIMYNQPMESIPPATNESAYPESSGLEYTSALGSMNPVHFGIAEKAAGKVEQKKAEEVVDKWVAQGIKPTAGILGMFQQIPKLIEEYKKSNAEVLQAQEKDNALQQEIDDAEKSKRQFQKQLSGMTPENVDWTNYDKMAKEYQSSITQAPKAPVLQQPRLNTQDQALVLLAGVLGGLDKVPDALQGAAKGAMERAKMANEQAQYQFQQEQENWNRQLQAKQVGLQTERERNTRQEAINFQKYKLQYQEINDSIQSEDEKIAKKQKLKTEAYNESFTNARLGWNNVIKQWGSSVDQNEIDKAKTKRAVLAKIFKIPLATAETYFPIPDEPMLTPEGERQAFRDKQFEAIQSRWKTSDRRADLQQALSSVRLLFQNPSVAMNGVITPEGAKDLNTQIDNIADSYEPPLPRQNFPVVEAGTKWQVLVTQFNAGIAQAGFNLRAVGLQYDVNNEKYKADLEVFTNQLAPLLQEKNDARQSVNNAITQKNTFVNNYYTATGKTRKQVREGSIKGIEAYDKLIKEQKDRLARAQAEYQAKLAGRPQPPVINIPDITIPGIPNPGDMPSGNEGMIVPLGFNGQIPGNLPDVRTPGTTPINLSGAVKTPPVVTPPTKTPPTKNQPTKNQPAKTPSKSSKTSSTPKPSDFGLGGKLGN
jgi:hypothetical protein